MATPAARSAAFIAENRRARFDYHIEERFEAGRCSSPTATS